MASLLVLGAAADAVAQTGAQGEVPSPAALRADDGTVARAEALFREGREAMRRHAYGEACTKFEQSEALDASPGTRLNWAICGAHLGQVAKALDRARGALESLGPDDDRRPIANRLVAELEPRVAHLVIRLGGPEATRASSLFVDGERVGLQGGETMRSVDAGEHVLLVEQPSHETGRFTVRLHEGETVDVSVAPGPGTDPHVGEPNHVPVAGGGPSPRRIAGYVFAGGSVVGLAAAGVTAVLALEETKVVRLHCPDKACDSTGFDAAARGRELLAGSEVALSLGIAGAAAAAILLWPNVAGLHPTVTPLEHGAAFAFARRF
jgi:hypothetical protein